MSNRFHLVHLFYKEHNIFVLYCHTGEIHIPESILINEINCTQTEIVGLIDKSFLYGDSYVYKSHRPEIVGNEVEF